MFLAQLHRKLTRDESDMEDLLTSNVFGTWRYVPADLGLLQFLGTARNCSGERLKLPESASIEMSFWPWLKESGAKGTEPDVFMDIQGVDGQRLLVLVEAKYLSRKSSFPDDLPLPNDQLAREMDNLRRVARRRDVMGYALLYVTASSAIPWADLRESAEELAAKTGSGDSDCFYWTSWRFLPTILSEILGLGCNVYAAAILTDLATILRRLGLVAFGGGDWVGWRYTPNWRFMKSWHRFRWRPIQTFEGYTYGERTPTFDWSSLTGPLSVSWRYES